MRTLILGLLVSLSALSLGCSVEGDDENSNGGQPSDTTAGTGGVGNAQNEGGEGGAAAGSGELGAAERAPLCETICATEAELPCPWDPEECFQVWCEVQPMAFPPCLEPYDAMLGCLAEAPVDDYMCDDGMPYPKPETCAPEKAALEMCLVGLGG